MQWRIQGQRTIYSSEWVNLQMVDVELPDGQKLAHHVLRMPRQSAVVALVQGDHVLMLWRHRFITNRWGWELPAGWLDPGEDAETAARRELLEETGWRADEMMRICSFSADSGISDSRFHLFFSTEAVESSQLSASQESERSEWIPLSSVRSLIENEQIDDGASLVGLLFVNGFNLASRPGRLDARQ